jgi:hypothetical protein
MITVQWANFSQIFPEINVSVSQSIFAVASSKTKILFFLKMALPRQRSYFWPTEKIELESVTSVSIPSLNDST